MGGETNVLTTYDKALNDFKVDHYSVVHEVECVQPTVVSLDFTNGLFNKERQGECLVLNQLRAKLKKSIRLYKHHQSYYLTALTQ